MKILELIDQKLLQEIQDLFSDATGLAAIAVGADGKYVTEGSNFTDFCMNYTRGTALGRRRCEKCDAECTGTYFCHAGLMDFSTDIIVDGEKVGAIIGGQVLPGEPDEAKFRGIAKELGIDPDEYVEALRKVPIKSEKSIRASAELLGRVVNSMVNLTYLQKRGDNIIKTMETELEQAVSSVESIMKNTRELDSIASKQSILALNASIEAARSGEAGVGFAVVAKQMGELANISSDIYGKITEDAGVMFDAINNMDGVLK